LNGYSYEELSIGKKDYIIKTITEKDVYAYAALTGDYSWLHINEARARQGRFKTRIVHGMFLAGLISNVVGTLLPGPGTCYESQNMRFVRPCYINDTIRAQSEVIGLLPRGRVQIRTTCYNQNNELLVDGEAIVIPPKKIYTTNNLELTHALNKKQAI